MVGEGSAPHCNWVRRRGVDTALPHFPLAEGRPPDGSLAGRHRPHEGSKEQHTWVNDNDE